MALRTCKLTIALASSKETADRSLFPLPHFFQYHFPGLMGNCIFRMRLHYGLAGPGRRGFPGDRSGRRSEGTGAQILTSVAHRVRLRLLPPAAAMAHRIEAVAGPARSFLPDPTLRHRR